jgi:hypothetical protein
MHLRSLDLFLKSMFLKVKHFKNMSIWGFNITILLRKNIIKDMSRDADYSYN